MRLQKLLASSGALALAAGLTLVVLGCSGEKKEVSLNFADCPAAVQKTISDLANGVPFPVVSAESKQDGVVVYEAKAKSADGKKIEIKVAADGHLLEFKTKDD